MKKLFAIAAMAVTLCLTGLVMSGEAQVQRFVDNGNGTVTDTMTGLMWTKDANMFGELFWEQAMEKCGSLSISGVGGWRLPSKDELLFLYYSINQKRDVARKHAPRQSGNQPCWLLPRVAGPRRTVRYFEIW